MQNTFQSYNTECKEVFEEIEGILSQVPSLPGSFKKLEEIKTTRQRYLEIEELIEGMELCSASDLKREVQQKMREAIYGHKSRLASLKDKARALEELANKEAREELLRSPNGVLDDPNASGTLHRGKVEESTVILMGSGDIIDQAIAETEKINQVAKGTTEELARQKEVISGWKAKVNFFTFFFCGIDG